jgi:hypothetical protein
MLCYCMRLFCGGLWVVLWWLVLFVKTGKGKSGCVILVDEVLSWLGSMGQKLPTVEKKDCREDPGRVG